MRVLGAQSLRVISELDLVELGPENAARAVRHLYHHRVRDLLKTSQAKLLSWPDTSEVHGGLVALTELASGFKARGLEQERQQVCPVVLIARHWDKPLSRRFAISQLSR